MLLHFVPRDYLFSPDVGSVYIFSTRNNCCEFFASYGVTFQSVTPLSPKCSIVLLNVKNLLPREAYNIYDVVTTNETGNILWDAAFKFYVLLAEIFILD